MSMRMSVLGSGSAGNCTLLLLDPPESPAPWKAPAPRKVPIARSDAPDASCAPGHGDEPTRARRPRPSTDPAERRSNGQPRVVLIDAGLSPRQTRLRLATHGIDLADVTDVFITHFDTDHFHNGWHRILDERPVAVHTHARQRPHLATRGIPAHRVTLFDDHGLALTEDTTVRGVMFAHDEAGSVGYLIEHHHTRLGFATDLGRATDEFFDHFTDLDALAIESNYDRHMQLDSARPWFLKQRIMNGAGHLSNDEALDAALRIDAASDLSHLVLLHLSRQCNCPHLVQRLYAQRAPHLAPRLTVTSQREPTPLLHLRRRDPAPHAKITPVRERATGRPPAGQQAVLF